MARVARPEGKPANIMDAALMSNSRSVGYVSINRLCRESGVNPTHRVLPALTDSGSQSEKEVVLGSRVRGFHRMRPAQGPVRGEARHQQVGRLRKTVEGQGASPDVHGLPVCRRDEDVPVGGHQHVRRFAVPQHPRPRPTPLPPGPEPAVTHARLLPALHEEKSCRAHRDNPPPPHHPRPGLLPRPDRQPPALQPPSPFCKGIATVRREAASLWGRGQPWPLGRDSCLPS